ncbi:MAG: 50S ribosomal protein L10 [Actinobacteria bacterium RBG_19FT_COMBO_54_7]|uniref:Large ribosomal subunit protein uL10 n=1 Tax=Candidatus Solincola sediminis TaxID=1797199 RepID=A0A1F2WMH3_9ACTN|nr:MAG: 50S ribosomal protein L10 [Candidatus Solincola sediminis]OFW58541.1 MAG: 50S ribosomal protein L10 [Candidatus Solincola sediminis]OFW70546.1 MAG: 50S ribosomal protein L10 [Actinobacteria bacterium RBG_19FT_COMBO_54_7]
MARPEKVAKMENIRASFLNNSVVFLTDFAGLSVEEISNLRSSLKEKGADYKVLKNTLTLLAIKDTDYEALSRFIVGPVAAAFTSGDAMAIAKELVAYARQNPKLKLKAGYMEGRVLDANAVKSVATLPPREVLLAKVMGSMRSPIYSLHSVLSGPYRKLTYALASIADAKSQAA